MKNRRPGRGGGEEVDNQVNSTATSSTPASPPQYMPPVDLNPDAYPIFAPHWFGIDRIDPTEIRPIWWRIRRREGLPLPGETSLLAMD